MSNQIKRDNFDRLEAYLFNKLNVAERTELETQLETQLHLADELALHEIEHEVMRRLTAQSIRNQFPPIKKNRFIWQPYAVAASFALLLLGGQRFITNQYGNDALMNKYFANVTMTSRGNNEQNGEEPIDKLLINAEAALKNNDFSAAKAQYEQALLLNKSADNQALQDKIEWNLLLTKFKNGENIQNDLANIAKNNKHSYHKQAIALTTTLASFWRKMIL